MRVYRASSLGYSLENLVAPHLGYEAIPPPAWLQEKYDEGTELEPVILNRLREDGWFIDSEQREVEINVIPDTVKVVGHLDGILHYQTEPGRVVEVKTMAESTWAKVNESGWDAGGIVEKYKWQQSAYVLATGLGHVLVCYNKANGELLSVIHDEPFYSISDIANKLSQAETHIRDGVIPEGCTDYPCPYFYLHEVKEEPEPADGQLDGLMNAWLEANRKAKIYKGEADALREMIVEYVGQEGKARVRGSQGVSVSVSWQEGKHVEYDTKPAWVTTVSAPKKGKDG